MVFVDLFQALNGLMNDWIRKKDNLNCAAFILSQSLHRSFLTGPVSKVETKKPPSSGRASPLVSAGQVLDKYFTLSKHQKDQQSNLHKSKDGLDPDVRQGALLWPLLF